MAPGERADRATAGKRRLLAGMLATAATLASGAARADDDDGYAAARAPSAEHVFVADGDFSMEATVRSFESLSRVIFLYERALPELSENRWARAAGRLAKFAFIDGPLADLTVVSIHEVAGHGGRARELGRSPTFSFKLPFPYRALFSPGDEEANFARAREGVRGQPDRETLFVMGGIESNLVTAQWLNRRLVGMGGRAHHADLLVYGGSKLVYADSFLGTEVERGGGRTSDDVASYVEGLQQRFNVSGAAGRRTIASRLRVGYIWNLVDPTLAFALWGTVVDALGRGRAYSEMPMPRLGGLLVYPTPRFGLTPFGAEQALDVRFAPAEDRDGRGPARKYATWVGEVYGRVGTSGLAQYQGAGAKLLDAQVVRDFRAGAEVDVWSQPVIDTEARSWFSRPNQWGGNVAGFGRARFFDRIGIVAKFGYKSSGHVQGLPVSAGLHGYIGLSIDPR